MRAMRSTMIVLAAASWLAACSAQSAPASPTGLHGRITGTDGQPLEGIVVSARADGKTFTTSVFSDNRGEYRFPPIV